MLCGALDIDLYAVGTFSFVLVNHDRIGFTNRHFIDCFCCCNQICILAQCHSCIILCVICISIHQNNRISVVFRGAVVVILPITPCIYCASLKVQLTLEHHKDVIARRGNDLAVF